jgi:isochorismate pyruvate lyase
VSVPQNGSDISAEFGFAPYSAANWRATDTTDQRSDRVAVEAVFYTGTSASHWMVEAWAGGSTTPSSEVAGDRFRRDKAGRLWAHPTNELVATPGQWVIAEPDPAGGTKFSGCSSEIFSLTFRTTARSVFQPANETRHASDLATEATPSTSYSRVGDPRMNGDPRQESRVSAPSADLLAAALGPALIELDGLVESLRAHRPTSLAELRGGMDTLDRLLIPLLVHRFWLMESAANLNSTRSAGPVPERATKVVSNAVERAQTCGASPSVTHAVEDLYSYLANRSIDLGFAP